MEDLQIAAALQAAGRIGIAALLGALVGLERELAGKPAGLRTHLLVAASAALLMLLGVEVVEGFRRHGEATVLAADPLRVIQAIVVGVSFLGAGTIIQPGGERVEGLTTAASILLTAALGLAVALGQILLAFLLTAGMLAVLVLLGFVERWLEERATGGHEAEAGDRSRPRAGRRRAPPGSG